LKLFNKKLLIVILVLFILLLFLFPRIHEKMHKYYFNDLGERTFIGFVDRAGHYVAEKIHFKFHGHKENKYINFIDYLWHYSENNDLNSIRNFHIDSRKAELEGLSIENIFEIQNIDADIISKIQLTNLINNKITEENITSSVRKHLLYDYPNTFSFSSHKQFHDLNYESIIQNNISNFETAIKNNNNKDIIKYSDLLADHDKKFINSQISKISKIAQEPKIKIILDKIYHHENYSYRLIYFIYETGLWGLKNIGAIYLPVKFDNQALIINPLGCGTKVGGNDVVDRQHNRMVSLAANGIAAVTMNSFCNNPPFHRYNDLGFARQHDSLFYISNTEIDTRDIELYNFRNLLDILSSKIPLRYNSLGLMGYSYGGVQSNQLARMLKHKYLVHVSTNIPTDAINVSKLISNKTKLLYIFSNYDSLTPKDNINNSIYKISSILNKINLKNNISTFYNNESLHNFGDEKSEIAINFIIKSEGKKCNKCYIHEEPGNIFDLSNIHLKNLTEKTYYDLYKNYIIKTNFSNRNHALIKSSYDLKKIIKEKFLINTIPSTKQHLLINKKKFIINNEQKEYNSWLVNFDDNLETLLYTFKSAKPDSQKILIVTDKLNDKTVQLEIENLLKKNHDVYAIELFGYGLSSDAQAPLGIIAKELININKTIMSININLLQSLIGQNNFNNITTYGPESAILIDTYSLLNDYEAQVFQVNSFGDFEEFFSNTIKPIVPPILLIENIYPAISFNRIRELKNGKKTKIISLNDMIEYKATQ